jgi:ABC-2 type transport system ATP-binding protein
MTIAGIHFTSKRLLWTVGYQLVRQTMISVKNLTMRYGSLTALDDISFDVNQGEILGLLGPNGAGKTTFMRVLTTYLYPSAGVVKVFNHDITQDPLAVQNIMGYLPETAPLYFEMQVDEYLQFVGSARGLAGTRLRERTKWTQDACGLSPVWKQPLGELSKGFRQRVGLAQALIHDPKLLILDEPTSGLDPLQIIGIRDLIRHLAKEKTIIFSTHILQEVEAMADRIVIINNGRIVANGTHEELAKLAHDVRRFHLSVDAPQEEVLLELRALDACDEAHHEGVFAQGVNRFLIRENRYWKRSTNSSKRKIGRSASSQRKEQR